LNKEIYNALLSLRNNSISVDEAYNSIVSLYNSDLGFANIDMMRTERTGCPEVVFCAGKTVEQAETVIADIHERGKPVLATKAGRVLAKRVQVRFPEAGYDELGQILSLGTLCNEEKRQGLIVVATAGTSDLPAAHEAVRTAEFLGSRVKLICDIGVAGIHRLFSRLDEIREARVIIACAGMEGALAGVLAGLVSSPVIALPTSVGYGASFGGLSALLGMLTSCAPGVSVVNIDNGFGAGYQANLINRS
jgi:NCAIR mutase (PurE)-related protein